jgi:hypothetical protein
MQFEFIVFISTYNFWITDDVLFYFIYTNSNDIGLKHSTGAPCFIRFFHYLHICMYNI